MHLMKNLSLVCGSMALSITPAFWRRSQRGLYLTVCDRKKTCFNTVYTRAGATRLQRREVSYFERFSNNSSLTSLIRCGSRKPQSGISRPLIPRRVMKSVMESKTGTAKHQNPCQQSLPSTTGALTSYRNLLEELDSVLSRIDPYPPHPRMLLANRRAQR